MGLPWMAASLTGATAFSAIVLTVPAQAAILSSWEYNPSNYELEILVPGGTTPRYSLVAEPARIIIDLPNT
ncbi:AMIN domain-containing protein, partial [filamentous cyanobacterium CCP1]